MVLPARIEKKKIAAKSCGHVSKIKKKIAIKMIKIHKTDTGNIQKIYISCVISL